MIDLYNNIETADLILPWMGREWRWHKCDILTVPFKFWYLLTFRAGMWGIYRLTVGPYGILGMFPMHGCFK